MMAQRKDRPPRHAAEPERSPAAARGVLRVAQHPATRAIGGVLLVVASVLWVYSPALRAPLIFDDMPSVVRNESIRQLWPLSGSAERPGPLQPPRQAPVSGRPLVNLTFAMNYALGGADPFSYHACNLALHIASALILWAMVQRTLTMQFFAGRFAGSANLLGFLAALLWALHPLAIDAVEYVTQRTELLLGCCYLLTFDFSWHYWQSKSRLARSVWLLLAVMASLAGMASKEVMVSAPVMVLLYERTFITGSFTSALRKSWPLYLGLSLTWILLALLNVSMPRSNTAGFHLGVSAITWWCTQAKVLLMYLKLVVWPDPLLIYYHVPYLETLSAAFPWLLAGAALAVLTAVLVGRRSSLGFVLAFVLAILSPTLVVPVVTLSVPPAPFTLNCTN